MLEVENSVTEGTIDRPGLGASAPGDGGILQLTALVFLILVIAGLYLLVVKPVHWGPEPSPPRTIFPYNGTQVLLPAAPRPTPPPPKPEAKSSLAGATFGIVPPAARLPEPESAFPAIPASRPPAPAGTLPQPASAGPPPALSPALSARSRWEWAGLWTRPGEFLLERTWLGSPGRLVRGLNRADHVDRFLERPLVRSVLASPTMVGLLLGNQALVGAFVKSPAMRDPAAVQALLSSRITQEVLASPGVQALFKDPGAMVKVFANPELVEWLRANPAAAERLGASSSKAPGRG